MDSRRARWAAFALLLALSACESNDLSGPLAGGQCGPNGECSKGYVCSATNECVKPAEAGSGGSGGGGGGAGGGDACGGCPSGQACCGAECVDLSSDTRHCNACDKACPNTKCAGGQCTNDCAPGFLDCDGNIVTNGCETEGTACDGGK